MVAQYSDEQIEDYYRARHEWVERADALQNTVLRYEFEVERAKEFARYGLARRLANLKHALQRIDDIYPPNSTDASRDDIRDAELILQAFVMKIFGAIDNLAWIWVLERNVKNDDGSVLNRTQVCFVGRNSKQLVNSLTWSIKDVVKNAQKWFYDIGEYRHGVAHQIPIYIPHILTPDEAKVATQLDSEINYAIEAGSTEDFINLNAKRNALGSYGPIMVLNDEPQPKLLHLQMVCDVATLVNLGEIVIKELPDI